MWGFVAANLLHAEALQLLERLRVPWRSLPGPASGRSQPVPVGGGGGGYGGGDGVHVGIGRLALLGDGTRAASGSTGPGIDALWWAKLLCSLICAFLLVRSLRTRQQPNHAGTTGDGDGRLRLDREQLQLEQELDDSDGEVDVDDGEVDPDATTSAPAHGSAPDPGRAGAAAALPATHPLRCALEHITWVGEDVMRSLLWPQSTVVRAARGDLLFPQGVVLGDLWVVLRGRVSLYRASHQGRRTLLATRRAGQPILSLLHLLGRVPAVGLAEADAAETVALRVPSGAWLHLLVHDADAGRELLRGEAIRFERLTQHILLRYIGLGKYVYRAEEGGHSQPHVGPSTEPHGAGVGVGVDAAATAGRRGADALPPPMSPRAQVDANAPPVDDDVDVRSPRLGPDSPRTQREGAVPLGAAAVPAAVTRAPQPLGVAGTSSAAASAPTAAEMIARVLGLAPVGGVRESAGGRAAAAVIQASARAIRVPAGTDLAECVRGAGGRAGRGAATVGDEPFGEDEPAVFECAGVLVVSEGMLSVGMPLFREELRRHHGHDHVVGRTGGPGVAGDRSVLPPGSPHAVRVHSASDESVPGTPPQTRSTCGSGGVARACASVPPGRESAPRATGAWPDKLHRRCLFHLRPGQAFGLMGAVAGTAGSPSLRAWGGGGTPGSCDGGGGGAVVAYLPQEAFERVMRVHRPAAFAALRAAAAPPCTTSLLWQLDALLEWRQAPSRRTIVRAGEPLDSMLVVLNGRLAVYDTAADTAEAAPNGGGTAAGAWHGSADVTCGGTRSAGPAGGRTARHAADIAAEPAPVAAAASGGRIVKREVGKGESIGELCILGSAQLPGVVRALRDSVIAIVPRQLLEVLSQAQPRAVLAVSRALATRHEAARSDAQAAGTRPNRYSTVALLPVSDEVPAHAFSLQLAKALRSLGPTLHLSSAQLPAVLDRRFGPRAPKSSPSSTATAPGSVDRDGHLGLWAGEQERTHAVVLYEADASATAWTRFCVRHADVVLLVARPSDEPSLSKAERALWPLIRTSQRRDVVLVHAEDQPWRPPRHVISRVLRERPPSAVGSDASDTAQEHDDDDAAAAAVAAASGDWARVGRMLRSRRRKLEGLLRRIGATRDELNRQRHEVQSRFLRSGSTALRAVLPHAAVVQAGRVSEVVAEKAERVSEVVAETADRVVGAATLNVAEAGAATTWVLQVSATKIQAMFVHRSLRRSARLAARVMRPMAEWLQERQPFCCHNVRAGHGGDMARLARLLTGSAVCVVLGGGGARGFAHVGVLRALTEAGVPIDMIGGTSQGAFVGALWAMSLDVEVVAARTRAWAKEMCKRWKWAVDATFPFTSWLSGAGFNFELGKVLGGYSVTDASAHTKPDVRIEDLWVPYFCVSTNLCRNRAEVHTRGVLWRYVRASMTLAGFLPPIFDRDSGDLLVDGGYVNNVPADVMREQGAHIVITVDVASVDDNSFDAYGDALSGWWLFWRSIWPFASKARVPSGSEVQSRLAYISSYGPLEDARTRHSDLFLNPPVAHIGLTDFHQFEEAHEIGYRCAVQALSEWLPRNRTFIATEDNVILPLFVGKTASRSRQQPSAAESERKAQLLGTRRTSVAHAAGTWRRHPPSFFEEHSEPHRVLGSASVDSVATLLDEAGDDDDVESGPSALARTLDKLQTARAAPGPARTTATTNS